MHSNAGFWTVALRSFTLTQLYELRDRAGSWWRLEEAPEERLTTWGVQASLAHRLCSAEDQPGCGRLVRSWEDGFPRLLRDLRMGPDLESCGPPVLFVEGDVRRLHEPGVCVVGTRRSTQAGRDLAREIGHTLAGSGRVVISGLAAGIDTAAHLGALDHGGGATVAVLGHGLGRTYPRSNTALRRRIVEEGGAVVSCWPDEQAPARWTFPVRNRWVAGLSDYAIVVEAPWGSGALLTAKDALALGRQVFVVPGRPGEHHSAGGQSLLMQAWFVRAGLPVPAEMACRLDEPGQPELCRVHPLWSLEQLGLTSESGTGDPEWLDAYLSGLTVQDVSLTFGLEELEVHRQLLSLELCGRVVRSSGQRYARAGSPS